MWLTVVSVLSTFNISKAKDAAGQDIEIVVNYSDTLRYDKQSQSGFFSPDLYTFIVILVFSGVPLPRGRMSLDPRAGKIMVNEFMLSKRDLDLVTSLWSPLYASFCSNHWHLSTYNKSCGARLSITCCVHIV